MEADAAVGLQPQVQSGDVGETHEWLGGTRRGVRHELCQQARRAIAAASEVVVGRAGVEGAVRGGGASAAKAAWDAVAVLAGLPVDGVHAVLEVGRGLELDLANDGPTDEDCSGAASDNTNDSDSSLVNRCSSAHDGWSGGRRFGSGSDIAGYCSATGRRSFAG